MRFGPYISSYVIRSKQTFLKYRVFPCPLPNQLKEVNSFNGSIIVRFSAECHKTKTKPITYQLESKQNQINCPTAFYN